MPTTVSSIAVRPDRDGLQTVSLSQAGAFDTMAACEREGVGIVAELHSADDAEALVASRYGHRIVSVFIVPDHHQVDRARAEAVAINATLSAGGVTAPRFEPEEELSFAAAA